MYRLAILLIYLRSVQTMNPLTKYLLTPLREQGEFCGYESCPMIINGVLNIHVIPHTHAELGYTRTFENHFTGRDDVYDKSNINMKRILDFVISELWRDPSRRFTFSELPYLYKWWSIRDGTVKRMVYQLIRQGRLQFVGGGWSMTEESTANYQAIIDQFTYSLRKLNATFLDCARPLVTGQSDVFGHTNEFASLMAQMGFDRHFINPISYDDEKLNATFLDCARPLVTWQSDVFGHTNEFASLMAQMGFDGHFINPISYDDELERMRSKRLEFVWQGSKDLGASSEIFTHKLFDGYWSPPGFCFGGQCSDPLIVDSNTAFNNVAERVKLFIEAMQYRQAPHYVTNHLVVMMGQRFGYYDAPLWFDNIDKLIKAVNHQENNANNVFMYYSTPACYLKAVRVSNASFPVESDDFVPIAYDKNTHFTGMFTSRPTVKYAAREGNIYLQITKQLQVLARLVKNEKFFEDFNWIMGVLQDHNILSGGMRPFVRDYYVNLIYQTLQSSERVVRDGLINLMKSPKIGYKRCLFNISFCEYTDQKNYHIVIYNPLGWNVTVPVRLPVDNATFTVYLPTLEKVQSVVMKIPQCIQDIPFNRTKSHKYELVFLAEDVPAFGYRSYFIEKMKRMRRSANFHDHFSNDGVKNDELDSKHNIEDNIHHIIMRSVDPKDHCASDEVINDDFDDMYDKNDNIHNLFSRNIRSAYYKDHFTNKEDKNYRFDDRDDRLGNDIVKNEFLKLHDITRNFRNFIKKVKLDLDILKEPNVTRIIRFKKNAKPNAELKRIFESITNEPDKIELDVVFGSARKTQNETNKNTTLSNLNKSNDDVTKHASEKYIDDVTKYIIDGLEELTTSKPNLGTTNIDSDHLNKDINAKTKLDKQKHVKNKNRNLLKGLKRCNCEVGRLKREHTEKNSEEATNDTIDHRFGNKTLRFIHFKQDEIESKESDNIGQKQDATNGFKREIKALKQNEDEKIKELKHEIESLKRKIIKIKHHDTKTLKTDEIKNLKREIQDLKREIQDLTKIKGVSNETRQGRSLFKKIKNAQKKYLRRQTNNLKIDDESLLNSGHHFDDEENSEEDDDFENTTEINERYVFEHVTDFSDYVVTPRTRAEYLNSIEGTSTTRETTTEATTTTEKPDPVTSELYSDTTNSYISNDYINITVDVHKNISYIALANGLTMALNINFYYFASDDPIKMGRAEYKKPGAFVFRPMDPEPVFIVQKPKIEVYKSSVVEEIHSNAKFASFVIRLYKESPFFEVEWIVRGIPISDGIGKEVFIRYNTDLETNGVFYTDSNGRQTIKRVFGHRPLYTPTSPDAIPGNYYPVTSKITIEDTHKLIRFSVLNDRTQGGSSFNGEIDLMLNRRVLTDDGGFQAFINETEDEIGTTVSGKHYIYVTKLSTKVNKIFEKKLAKEIGVKPQVFVSNRMIDKSQWKNFQNEFVGVNKIPVGLNILTLQEWNDGSFLLRIENYLEKSDVLRSGIKKIVLQNLFTVFRIIKVRETTLAGNIFIEDFVPLRWKTDSGNTEKFEPPKEVKVNEEILFTPQQIRTFIIWVEFHENK